jgi:hypothetical protein
MNKIKKMNKERALDLGNKVMNEIGFDWWDRNDERGVTARLITSAMDTEFGEDYWLISFPYGKEDYGENVRYHISILDASEIAKNISFRNGFVKLGIDADGKYFIAERRP